MESAVEIAAAVRHLSIPKVRETRALRKLRSEELRCGILGQVRHDHQDLWQLRMRQTELAMLSNGAQTDLWQAW